MYQGKVRRRREEMEWHDGEKRVKRERMWER